METNLNRNEKILALMTLGAICGFAVLFIQINLRSGPVSQIDSRIQVNYQMARPDEGYSEYSLNGREIDRTYESLKKAEAAKKAAAPGTTQTAAVDKKTEAQKKAETAKKKTEEAQKAAALARSQAQTQVQKQKSAEQQRSSNHSESKTSNDSQVVESAAYNQSVGAEQTNNNKNAEEANADKAKNKKTFAQWRAQIFAQPTNESINSFLEAYRKGDVSATEVQAMAQDLMDQNNETLKGLGLYTLRATPSLASLSQLVHIQAQMSSTYKAYIEQGLLAYLQPQNVNYLGQALQTQDKTLISKMLSVLNTNLPNIAKGNNSALVDPRNGREAGAGSNITMSAFTSLLPVLSSLVSSQQTEFASLAQQAMSYIQSSNNVAQN